MTSLCQRSTRKENQIKTAANKSKDAKTIKLADATSNLRAISLNPAADWSVKRRLDYIEWAKQVAAGLRGASPFLEEQFDLAAEQPQRFIAAPINEVA